MSSQHENDIAKQVHRSTSNEIKVYTCGYSGNNAFPQPDILVTTPTIHYGVEMKGPIKSDTVYVDEEDLSQLMECRGPSTAVGLYIKFQRREPLVVRHFKELTGSQSDVDELDGYNDASVAEQFKLLIPSAFNPRVTKSGVLACDKPSTDEWSSASAGSDDHQALLSGLGVPTEDSTDVTHIF